MSAPHQVSPEARNVSFAKLYVAVIISVTRSKQRRRARSGCTRVH